MAGALSPPGWERTSFYHHVDSTGDAIIMFWRRAGFHINAGRGGVPTCARPARSLMLTFRVGIHSLMGVEGGLAGLLSKSASSASLSDASLTRKKMKKPTLSLLSLLRVCALAIMGALVCAERASGSESPRPNILLILADDLGFSDLRSYGGEIRTPNLDKLARDGMRFTQFYNAAVWATSRASLMTGVYNRRMRGG